MMTFDPEEVADADALLKSQPWPWSVSFTGLELEQTTGYDNDPPPPPLQTIMEQLPN